MAVLSKAQAADVKRNRICENVAMDPDLDGVDLRVFLYLIARLDFNGFVHVPQIEMAVTLGRRKEHISRAIRKLTSKRVLLAGPKGIRASEWQLNPHYGE